MTGTFYKAGARQTLAASTGSFGGLGKIGTIPASNGYILVCADCTEGVKSVDWEVGINKAWTYQLGRSMSRVEAITLTLSSLADTETIVINGLTFTAEDTEVDAVASERKFWTGDTGDAEDAENLAALINNATYGVPGVTAEAATGVVTLTPSTTDGAHVIQAATGTAGAHCAVSYTGSLANMTQDGAVSSGQTAVTAYAGQLIAQAVDGWQYAYIVVTNTDGSNAATAVVRATKH